MELTEKQYNHIALCVEIIHRISCGNIRELNQILPISIDGGLIIEIKRQVFPELSVGSHYGWNGGYDNKEQGEEFCKYYDTFQAQGYQIYRQMRYKQNIAKGINDVLSSETLKSNKAEQPIIEIIKEE